ncbi:MAG: hypothetical protein Q8P15_01985 [Nanoarchaeota archaeon]|nr:hypothetical protein [Nanoarchaeota archaeon]
MELITHIFGREKIKPVRKAQRYPCPFYGFSLDLGMLTDTKGNQCALITESCSPCRMEMDGQTPSWVNCNYINNENNTNSIEKIDNARDNIRVFPDEFYQEEMRVWTGIKFKDWIKYTLGKNSLIS